VEIKIKWMIQKHILVTIPDKCLLHKVGKVVFHLFGGIGGGVETDYEDK
jgi:hypothetical protein